MVNDLILFDCSISDFKRLGNDDFGQLRLHTQICVLLRSSEYYKAEIRFSAL